MQGLPSLPDNRPPRSEALSSLDPIKNQLAFSATPTPTFYPTAPTDPTRSTTTGLADTARSWASTISRHWRTPFGVLCTDLAAASLVKNATSDPNTQARLITTYGWGKLAALQLASLCSSSHRHRRSNANRSKSMFTTPVTVMDTINGRIAREIAQAAAPSSVTRVRGTLGIDATSEVGDLVDRSVMGIGAILAGRAIPRIVKEGYAKALQSVVSRHVRSLLPDKDQCC